jgi:hypothetical protein
MLMMMFLSSCGVKSQPSTRILEKEKPDLEVLPIKVIPPKRLNPVCDQSNEALNTTLVFESFLDGKYSVTFTSCNVAESADLIKSNTKTSRVFVNSVLGCKDPIKLTGSIAGVLVETVSCSFNQEYEWFKVLN